MIKYNVIIGMVAGTALGLYPTEAAQAQLWSHTPVTVRFKADGRVEAVIEFDVDAVLADIPYRELTDEDYKKLRETPREERSTRLEEIKEFLRIRGRLKFDGIATDVAVDFPDMEAAEKAGESNPLPGKRFALTAKVPEGAKEFVFTASPIFGGIALLITEEGAGKGRREVLPPGGESSPYPVPRMQKSPPAPGAKTETPTP